ncbi:hypothetical protein [Salinispora arenicola]|uniref:hypothetical protein n=1 Tax=Salinispora arenicola TaxID=168697 RepID=UPI000363D719|nr:hypothetical protein [Salinispora arenicola]
MSAQYVPRQTWRSTRGTAAVLVCSAGKELIARLAQGLADSSRQTCLQMTEAFVGAAPGLPPGQQTSFALCPYLALLVTNPLIAVGSTVDVASATIAKREDGAGTLVPATFDLLEQHRGRRRVTKSAS